MTIPRLVATFAFSLIISPSASALELTDCSVVPRGVHAVLQNDLVCATPLLVEHRGTLDLNGFTIDGIVRCETVCAVVSGGSRGRVRGIELSRGVVSNVEVDCVAHEAPGGGPSAGIVVERRTDLSDVAIRNCRYGISRAGTKRLPRINAERLILADNDWGVEINLGTFVGTDVETHDNLSTGLGGGRVKVANLVATGNGWSGVAATKSLSVEDAVVTGNALARPDRAAGIWCSGCAPRIRNATVTGNASDVASTKEPKLKDVACDTSRVLAGIDVTPESWGVCPGE